MEPMEETRVWEIIPNNTPPIIKNCNKCKKKMKFYCSERFRLNAQKKRIDVWLIYKCVDCDSTWNIDIMSRVNPGEIPKDLYEKFLKNDKETAWGYAFDYEVLKRACDEIVYSDVDYTINGATLDFESFSSGLLTINLVSKYGFDLRLDKVLRKQLNISKNRLYELIDNSVINIIPEVNIRKHKIKEKLNLKVTVA